MTPDTRLLDKPAADEQADPVLDAPFSLQEKIRFPLTLIVLPWVGYLPLMFFVAQLRVYPELPWFTGLWLAPLVLTVSYMVMWCMVMCHPRIVREAVKRTWSDYERVYSEEMINEKVARWLQIFLLVGYLVISSYDAADSSTHVPVAVRAVACLLVVASFWMATWTVCINKYAGTVLLASPPETRVTNLVKTGPYAIVRHPFYIIMFLYSVGMPLVIGSYWGLIPSALNLPLSMWRTGNEEEKLVRRFGEEYEQYKREVPSKMIPGVF